MNKISSAAQFLILLFGCNLFLEPTGLPKAMATRTATSSFKSTSADRLPPKQQGKSATKRGKNIGCWSSEEQLKYIKFINSFQNQLRSKLRRKDIKIFRLMAEFIQTRTAVQCRCHHNKSLRTFRTIQKAVQKLNGQIEQPEINMVAINESGLKMQCEEHTLQRWNPEVKSIVQSEEGVSQGQNATLQSGCAHNSQTDPHKSAASSDAWARMWLIFLFVAPGQ